MDNKEFLEKLKFGVGDGNIQYYIYNWKCPLMPAEKFDRNAFIQALSRFSILNIISQVMEVKAKNVKYLKILISVAQTDGSYLSETWYDV
ncbi:unnamed protein product [Rotaria sordida]|uniref:Glycylpeptide N-tetradecanoyltransferase n=2 Tax=Rotaria sordida TaxID=392033 RepID=A0A819Y173_9BILA|nr:unnamed protein product [Rotaria sordida]